MENSKVTTSLDKVAAVIAKQLGKKVEDIKAEHRIVEDLNADSLDVIEMLMTLEDDYGVAIPDEEAPKLNTVGKIVEYLDKNVAKK
ncbi:MAG: acyl carrier protein [Firmicutes bacterium]|nr:acyl carrier protein [Bacillota bacterium]